MRRDAVRRRGVDEGEVRVGLDGSGRVLDERECRDDLGMGERLRRVGSVGREDPIEEVLDAVFWDSVRGIDHEDERLLGERLDGERELRRINVPGEGGSVIGERKERERAGGEEALKGSEGARGRR